MDDLVAFIWAFLIIVGVVFSLLSGNVISLNDTILTSANENSRGFWNVK